MTHQELVRVKGPTEQAGLAGGISCFSQNLQRLLAKNSEK